MSDLPNDSRSILSWLLDACLTVLAGALALYAAVWLLRAVWPALVIVGGCVAAIAVLVSVIRWRSGRW